MAKDTKQQEKPVAGALGPLKQAVVTSQPPGTLAITTPPADDVPALKARISELEKALAARDTTSPPEPVPAPGMDLESALKRTQEMEARLDAKDEELLAARREAQEARSALDELRSQGLSDKAFIAQRERLLLQSRKDVPAESVGDMARELLTADTARVAGVIQVEDKGERHRLYRLTTRDGALVLQEEERGEDMPWHAARALVDRLVQSWLPPEGKR